jgi:F-type H+-transporting ATPase subunit b
VFPPLIFWSIVSFGILLFLLWRYAYPTILGALEEREKKIQGDISGAEKLRNEAQRLREELELQLKKAHEKASAIVQMAEDESRKKQDKALQETQSKCRQMLEEAENEIRRTRDKLLGEIRGYTAALTIASTEKILRKTISDADKKRLADESIEEVLQQLQRQKSSA